MDRRVRRWAPRLLAVFGVLVLIAAGLVILAYTQASQSNIGDLSFRNRLKIPPVLEPTVDANGRKHFALTLQTGRTELLPGTSTETWGANGSYLGPTLRASRGDEVAIDVVNQLPEPSTLHWHGMRLPAPMDGGPHQSIEPGPTWSPHWTVDQPAASLWYHPHLHGRTAEHVYRGISGMFLIDDESSTGLALPNRYGVDDLPLVVQDKEFARDGSLAISGGGLFDSDTPRGDRILVNGTFDPRLEVSTTRVRLRVLNAGLSRPFNIGFTDGRPFQVIGTDGGLLDAPVAVDRIRLAPAERAEIVAEFRPGEEVVLRSFATGDSFGDRFSGGDDEFDLLKIVAGDTLSPSPPVPNRLGTAPEITAPAGAKVRTFRMNGSLKINSKAMDLRRIDEVVPAGATEIWEITNPGVEHTFHIHDVAFRIMDVAGRPPPGYARGRKDTVQLPGGGTVRIAVQFGTHVDPASPYMYHCHLLKHEDKGMMGQFVIVEPGTENQTSRQLPGDGHAHGGR